MKVISSPSETREFLRTQRSVGSTIGVVPTMGALHAGHVSLMEAGRPEVDELVATIFVNPTQFGPNEDFAKYPRTLQADLQMCESAGVDVVFTPSTDEMYSASSQTAVSVGELTTKLEGDRRPGHFDGVTTVVGKLFNITCPDRAYFGQKDYQQQLVIRRMVEDLDWGIEVVTCPIVREADGLAMSSRNRYLSSEERERSLVLYRALQLAETLAEQGTRPAEITATIQELIAGQNGVVPDYATVVCCNTLEPVRDDAAAAMVLLAAKVGNTRLIDNQRLQFR